MKADDQDGSGSVERRMMGSFAALEIWKDKTINNRDLNRKKREILER